MGRSQKQKSQAAPSGNTAPAQQAPADVPIAATSSPPEAKKISILESPKVNKMMEDDARALREALYTEQLDTISRREDRALMFPSQTNQEKLAGFKKFASLLSDPVNARVLRVFLAVSLLIFVAPLLVLFVGMHVIAPSIGMEDDAETVGAFGAVATVVIISVVYVVYALRDDAVFDERVQLRNQRGASGAAASKQKMK